MVIVAGLLLAFPSLAQAQEDSAPLLDRQISFSQLSDWFRNFMFLSVPVLIAIFWSTDLIRPGSFKRAGLRDVKAHPALIWLFAAFIVLYAANLGGQLAISTEWLIGPDKTTTRAQAVQTLGQYFMGIGVGAAMLYLIRRDAPKGGLEFKVGDLVLGISFLALTYPIIYAASEASGWVYTAVTRPEGELNPIAHETLRTLAADTGDAWAWTIAFAAVIGAPIVEELIYRALLQSAILRVTKRAWPAILICSTLFMAMHIPVVTDARPLVPLFLLGVALGIAFERTKRIGVPIAMHMAFNALNLGLALGLS